MIDTYIILCHNLMLHYYTMFMTESSDIDKGLKGLRLTIIHRRVAVQFTILACYPISAVKSEFRSAISFTTVMLSSSYVSIVTSIASVSLFVNSSILLDAFTDIS